MRKEHVAGKVAHSVAKRKISFIAFPTPHILECTWKIFTILQIVLIASLMSTSLASTVECKLTQIQRTQALQERRLHMIELRLSSVLSKLGHLTHVPELSISWWESNSNRTLNRMDEHIQQLLRSLEPIGSLQEIHSNLKKLLQMQAANETQMTVEKEMKTIITTKEDLMHKEIKVGKSRME